MLEFRKDLYFQSDSVAKQEEYEYCLNMEKELLSFAIKNNKLFRKNTYDETLKWYIVEDGFGDIRTRNTYNRDGNIYFSDEEIAEKAIKYIGEDNLKKYFKYKNKIFKIE